MCSPRAGKGSDICGTPSRRSTCVQDVRVSNTLCTKYACGPAACPSWACWSRVMSTPCRMGKRRRGQKERGRVYDSPLLGNCTNRLRSRTMHTPSWSFMQARHASRTCSLNVYERSMFAPRRSCNVCVRHESTMPSGACHSPCVPQALDAAIARSRASCGCCMVALNDASSNVTWRPCTQGRCPGGWVDRC